MKKKLKLADLKYLTLPSMLLLASCGGEPETDTLITDSSPTPSASITPTPISPAPSPEPTPVATPTPTPVVQPTPEASPAPMPTPGAAETPSPTPTPLPSPMPTPLASPEPTPSPIPSPVPTSVPTPIPSPSPTPEPSPSATPTPGATPIPGLAIDRSGWSLTASNNAAELNLAIDSDNSTRWTTEQTQQANQWVEIGLSAIYEIDYIQLESEASPNDYPRGYDVEVSIDGLTWTTVANGSGNGAITNIELNDTDAERIRIIQLGSSDSFWWSIHELNVYGELSDTQPTPAPTPTPVATPSPTPASGSCEINGILEVWHRVELRCNGYAASETDETTFTDLRFNVTFSNEDSSITVPGHFAADGAAGDSGAVSGYIWRAYFSPPETGQWDYEVSFRAGPEVAVSLEPSAGEVLAPLDGITGTFSVSASGAVGKDMRAKGLLQHRNGERYLRHAGNDSIFIEGGMDSPENILGYSEFDNTVKFSGGACKGILHDFEPHLDDWNDGDPTWADDRGKSLIGLINYISSHNVNAIYMNMNTVNGDGCDAHPWTSYNENSDVKSFDVSKLDQWEVALSHMTANGILLHVMTQETENDQDLNDGELGLERKLYYRELISRFSHHPALQWNLGEENTNTSAQIKDFADYIRDLDPYDHPLFMHTYPNTANYDRYTDLLGHPTFNGPTFQVGEISTDAEADGGGVYGMVVDWQAQAQAAGHPWVITFTEASGGQAPTPNESVSSQQRVFWMWASVMSGGAGFEWYLKNDGAGHAYDLAVEDLREFDQHWEQAGYLTEFFSETLQSTLGIDLQSLQPDNEITTTISDWVLADAGNTYLIYLREGGSTEIDLPDNSEYSVLWMNPRTGEHYDGDNLQGPGNQSIGAAPEESDQDWAVVVTLTDETANLHPDIVMVVDIPESDILRSPQSNWVDSYSVGDECYCETTFDHNIGDILVDTAEGTMTVFDACEAVGPGPGSAGRPLYNDVQCGNGPANDAGDEDYCPGRIDIGKEGCVQIGPKWKF